MITNVDDKGARNGINSDPFVTVHNLKPFNVVLQKKSHEAVIGVWWHPQRQLRLWTRRITVHNHQLTTFFQLLGRLVSLTVDFKALQYGFHHQIEHLFRFFRVNSRQTPVFVFKIL